MEWMKEQGDYSQEEVELMQSKLRIRWREDDPSVPPGWKTRTSQIKSKVSQQSPHSGARYTYM